MKQSGSGDRPTDADLVAFLDGELGASERAAVERALRADAAVRDRLAMLASGGRAFRQSFDTLLEEAPRDRLDEIWSQALGASRAPTDRTGVSQFRGLARAAAALLLVVAGGVGGFMAASTEFGDQVADALGLEDESYDWRETVARQVSLYSAPYVASMPVDEAAVSAGLDRSARLLDMPLSRHDVALPGLELRRVDLLQYDDRPIAQLLYYSKATGPVALCIMAEREVQQAPNVERRAGLNLVFWTGRGRGFVLLGRASQAQLQPLAAEIAEQLSS
jgi:anti-sigma factor RsiW